MHKIFADNGISYTEKGIMTGNYSGGVAAGTSYGGRIFQNLHSSAASARTYEIAGRANSSSYGRFDGSNIKNWLGLSTEKTQGGTYTGQTFTGADTPDTFFLLAGTNDLLSDNNNSTLHLRLDGVTYLLLSDMDSIVSSIRTANSHASILVMTIPCWTQHSNGNLAETHQAVATYNESLKEWAQKMPPTASKSLTSMRASLTWPPPPLSTGCAPCSTIPRRTACTRTPRGTC